MKNRTAKIKAFNADQKAQRERRMATPIPTWKKWSRVFRVIEAKNRFKRGEV